MHWIFDVAAWIVLGFVAGIIAQDIYFFRKGEYHWSTNVGCGLTSFAVIAAAIFWIAR